jgi:hypothetical protein
LANYLLVRFATQLTLMRIYPLSGDIASDDVLDLTGATVAALRALILPSSTVTATTRL